MTPPLVVVERHRNRKSVPDCDAFQKNAERCKNLTCFALRGTKAAPPYPADALAYRSGSAASAARSCPRPNEGQSRDIFASLTRAFQSRRRPRCLRLSLSTLFVRSDVNVTHARKKKPPTKVGGAGLTSKLTVDLVCRPGLGRPAGHLARASAPADPASAGRRRPAGRPGPP
jgi:hypothetical protein